MDPKPLTIANWNACSIRNKIPELVDFLVSKEVDVVTITETHLKPSINAFIPGFRLLRLDRTGSGGGGVAVAVKSGISCRLLPSFNLKVIEAIGIEVDTSLGPIVIITAYCPKQARIRDGMVAELRNDLSKLTRRQAKYIIGGDFNARHESWGNQRRNMNGRILAEDLETGHYTILAPACPTRISRSGVHSTLDVFLTNFAFNDEPVVYDELSSDHYPVVLTVGAAADTAARQPRRNYHRANWPAFQRVVDENMDYDRPLESTEDIDQALESLQHAIAVARDTAVPVQQHRVSTSLQIDPTTKHLIRLRNIFRRQYQRTGDRTKKTNANQLTRVIQERMQDQKNRQFGQMIRRIPPHSKPFWALAKVLKIRPKPIPPLVSSGELGEGNILFTPAEKANALGQQFVASHNLGRDIISPFEGAVAEGVATVVQSDSLVPEEAGVTADELASLARGLRNMKAPGFDQTFNLELKHLSQGSFAFVARLFNRCWELGYFPSVWKLAKVIPVLKPGKDPSVPKSYRPISLLSALSKLFEKTIQTRILFFIDENGVLPEEQFGFRKGRSTIHQLSRVTKIIKQNKSMSKTTAMALLDIEKAFDNVWHDGLVYKLHRLNLPMYLVKIIQSYLSNRTFQVSLQSVCSERFNIGAGVPQGSILGPLLYNIYTADIPSLPGDGVLSQFADDTAIMYKGRVIRPLTRRLQSGLDVLNEYYTSWKIVINAAKTQTVLFPHSRSPRLVPAPDCRIRFGGSLIEWSDEVVYLGLTLDSHLIFRSHVDKTVTKCNVLVRSLYPLICRTSNLCLKNKMAVYKQIVFPMIEYAAPVWTCCARSHRLKLQRVQNKFLKMILNLPPWTRTTEVHERANLDTLDIKFENICQKFGERCASSEHETIREIVLV